MYAFIILFFVMFVAVIIYSVVVVAIKSKNNGKKKGDFISPSEPDPRQKEQGEKHVVPEPEQKAEEVKPAEKPSPVHANCDHAKTPSPYIDVNDTYSMNWDEFKSFALRLFAAEYPTAVLSPYKYRGSPDIQLKTGGRDVDVRLIFLRENDTVGKDDFNAAMRDVDEKDDVCDWLLTNGRFSLAQRTAAGAKNITLLDVDDLSAMMRRCNISAKK